MYYCPVISFWLQRICEAAVAGGTVGFPPRPDPAEALNTQSFQRNAAQKDPKAPWSFPVSCFYSVSQCVCPWKEQWRSLAKVCAEQRLATLNTSCPVAYTLTSSWHHPAFLLMVHYCLSAQRVMHRVLQHQKHNIFCSQKLSHTHTLKSLLKTLLTTQKHTQAVRR